MWILRNQGRSDSLEQVRKKQDTNRLFSLKRLCYLVIGKYRVVALVSDHFYCTSSIEIVCIFYRRFSPIFLLTVKQFVVVFNQSQLLTHAPRQPSHPPTKLSCGTTTDDAKGGKTDRFCELWWIIKAIFPTPLN